MERFWGYDIVNNLYHPVNAEPLSTFPTIVDLQKKMVFCRLHKKWEPILAFKSNGLKSGCGKLYDGPFSREGSVFSYGYEFNKRKGNYYITVKTQTVSTTYRRLKDVNFELNSEKKRLYQDGLPVFESLNANAPLCPELTKKILDDIGEEYKTKFGIKPSVASKLHGFNVILGYMLCPFNVNFFKIAQHWGLNPYDPEFASLSSGDTPDAENEMFSSMDITPTKAIRKLYQKYPQAVICYAAAKDMGFTDANILQKSATKEVYTMLDYFMISFAGGTIYYSVQEPLQMFVRDALAFANQKTVWNCIERTAKFLAEGSVPSYEVVDALNTYRLCSRHLEQQEIKDIMHEGFNTYTHDFLVRRQNMLAEEGLVYSSSGEKNIVFEIEPKFLELEYKAGDARRVNPVTKESEPVPDSDRWCFHVARDSFTLKTIGSCMHNCVGWGYAQSVAKRRATIVYAMYKEKYQICIEVTPDFQIRQSLGPHNRPLEGDALEAYFEWCDEKSIKRTKAFGVHGAP